jgi:hypothetical protein
MKTITTVANANFKALFNNTQVAIQLTLQASKVLSVIG